MAGPRVKIEYAVQRRAMRQPFTIARRTFESNEFLVFAASQSGRVGLGEAAGVFYRHDLPHVMAGQIEAVRSDLESGVTRSELRQLLPPGGARCAVDCALWELEAKLSGRTVWDLAGLADPKPLRTTFTLGVDDPDRTGDLAVERAAFTALKLKLAGDGQDAERVAVVRSRRPDAWLGVDANQALDRAALEDLLPTLLENRVELIEQPLPAGRDAALRGLACPIDIAADESLQGLDDLVRVGELYDVVNIKLDKCGGLTEALLIARAAREAGLRVMVGNMAGTVLSMAPACLLGQLCSIVDLDGPLLLMSDRSPATEYRNGTVQCPSAAWGHASSDDIRQRMDS